MNDDLGGFYEANKKGAELFEKCLNAYDEVIGDLDNNIEKWKDYGSIINCVFCEAYGRVGCLKCPLYTLSDDNCMNKTYYDLKTGISYYIYGEVEEKEDVIKLLIERRKELLNLLGKFGYEYK